MSNNKPIIFAPGTRITIEGEPHLITEVSLDTGRIQYGTDLSAWHDHEDCVFVSAPTKKSIQEAIDAIADENEGDDDYDEEILEDDPDDDDDDLTMNDGG